MSLRVRRLCNGFAVRTYNAYKYIKALIKEICIFPPNKAAHECLKQCHYITIGLNYDKFIITRTQFEQNETLTILK